jgi:hypothetical protein
MYTVGHADIDTPTTIEGILSADLTILFPSKLSRCYQVNPKNIPKYSSNYVVKYTPGLAFQNAPNYSSTHSANLLYCA